VRAQDLMKLQIKYVKNNLFHSISAYDNSC
jgi:hypothetical protein